MNPAANWAVPGTNAMPPNGNIWVGADGMVHGNLVDPTTGDVHLKSPKPNGAGKKYPQPTPPRPVYRR